MKFATLVILLACLLNIGLISAKKKGKDEVDSENCECGQTNIGSNSNLLVKQIVIPSNKYPWMVALMTMPDKEIFCSGAIINRHFILTSANCVEKYVRLPENSKGITSLTVHKDPLSSSVSFKKLRVGFLTDTDTYNVSEGAEVEKIISYPGFKPSNFFVDDIALLKLKKPLKCNDFARPVCLPGKNMDIKTEDLFGITSWESATGDSMNGTKALYESLANLSSPEKCSRMRTYAKHSRKSLCLKGYNRESPCLGDYGGSMFQQYKERHYVVGVSAKTNSTTKMHCDSEADFVVYTSVQAYMPWIQNITGISPMKN